MRAGPGIGDLGAEATSFFRKGVEAVSAEEQIARLMPVLERLGDLPAVISVDTRSAEVARAVLERGGAGVRIINDVSAGTHDVEMLPVVAEMGAAVILMHISPGYPATPVADDADVVATVREFLAERFATAAEAGIAPERIALDPGIGFGKTMADNWRLVFRAKETLPENATGAMVVLGTSRKRFLETEPPKDVALPGAWGDLVNSLRASEAASHPRDVASAALTAFTARQGAAIHRVHNAALAARAMWELRNIRV